MPRGHSIDLIYFYCTGSNLLFNALTDIDEEACEKQELCNRTGAMRKTGAYGTRPHMRSHFMFTTLLHFSYRIANPKQRAQIAIAPRGSGVPGMSAPGAGGEAPLFPICDSAPRDTGDPSKSALGAGRRGVHPAPLAVFTLGARRRTCAWQCTTSRSTCRTKEPPSSPRCPRYWALQGSSWCTTAACRTGSTPTCPQRRRRCRESTRHCRPQR